MSLARRMQQAAAGSAGAGPEPSGWTDPDLGNASYDSVSFSVASQTTNPQDVSFKPDGTKMYVVGYSGQDVSEYALSSAWDITTASYTQNFSVASQVSGPTSCFFSTDGTKMYILDFIGDDVTEYNLSTAWDISSASYVQDFSVATQENQPLGMFFKPDGTKMYVSGGTGDDVNEYALSTAWDVSTASFSHAFSMAAQVGTPQGIFFSPNGDRFFVIDGTGDDVNEYALSTAWDVSSGSYVQNFSVAAQETQPSGIFFKSDGSKMYVVGTANDTIYQYSTAAAAPAEWTDPDLANASYDGVSVNQEAGSELTSSVTIFRFKPDGTRCYIGDIGSDSIHQYSLTTAWDLSSSSLDTSFSVVSQETQPRDIAFSPDGTVMFMLGSGVEAMYEYSLSTGWDISTASYTGTSFSNWPSVSEEPASVLFNENGTKCYVADYGVDAVWQFSLDTAYSLSTISYDSKSLTGLATYGGQVSGIYFSPVGDKLFVSFNEASGQSTGGVFQFSLSTAYDISTASYDSVSFILNEDCGAGLEFKSDGLKAYNAHYPNGVGATYQYSTAAAAPAEWIDPDLANASYDSVSFSVAAQATIPLGLAISEDGSKFYVSDNNTNSVFQYNLSTPWNLTSASYSGSSLSTSSQDGTPFGMSFKPDGLKMYLMGTGTDTVYQYSLTTSWDISTASYDSVSFSVSSQDSSPSGVRFKTDGTKMYILGRTGDAIFQYALSTAWDISTASYESKSLSVSSQESFPISMFMSPTGSAVYVLGNGNDTVYQYDLGTDWDISTGVYNTSQTFDVGGIADNQYGLTFKSDGSKMYTVAFGTDRIYQYST